MVKKFWLRWRFDFHNKPTKYGGWMNDDQKPEAMAAYVNKDGLLRAAIEAKNLETAEVKIVAECDGHDFWNFQWVATAIATRFGPCPRTLIGMKLQTRTTSYEFYVDGSKKVAPFDYLKAVQMNWHKH